MSSIATTLTKIQTVDLPRPAIDRTAALVITDAIRATGLGPGAQFYFDPTSVEALGLLLAFGEPSIDPTPQTRFTRAVQRSSPNRESLELEIPIEGLQALDIDAHIPDSARVMELSVWAGSQLLGFGISE
ncbi:hypothetical protein [Halocatena pleomorpha]|uniref:Uncharacterized protein n=1 Tax=Halocatena pleomorpha TaxID=1785090 RepID=A0A3P3RJK0_9EURY|nr:hypothetical protein [Halocatena pleomorpha]RRJ33592.1 hypothetical protein EIK79_01995 [Halocatena pleomorpha]